MPTDDPIAAFCWDIALSTRNSSAHNSSSIQTMPPSICMTWREALGATRREQTRKTNTKPSHGIKHVLFCFENQLFRNWMSCSTSAATKKMFIFLLVHELNFDIYDNLITDSQIDWGLNYSSGMCEERNKWFRIKKLIITHFAAGIYRNS